MCLNMVKRRDMPRKSLDHLNCSWAQTAEAVGDKWSIMIIRSAFYGVSSFSEFQEDLGISKNVLSQRLDHLVEHEVFERKPTRPGSSRCHYKLTRKGRALFPAIVALGQWGDEWIFGANNEPVVILDRENRRPIQTIRVRSAEGKPLKLGEVTYVEGTRQPHDQDSDAELS